MIAFLIAFVITIIGFTMLLYFMLTNVMATRMGPGRHRRRRISLGTMLAGVGLWECAIGAYLIALGDGVSAVGPLGLGLMMLAATAIAHRFRIWPGE